MGRKRTKFSDAEDKTLKCGTCGTEHRVSGDSVSVQCDICLLGLKPISKMTPAELDQLDKNEKAAKVKPIDIVSATAKEFVKKMETDPINSLVKNLGESIVGVKRGRGRPRKNPILPPDKKGNVMANEKVGVEKKVDVVGGTGKRGRKSTVGSAVLGFVKAQAGEVKFADILNVYSSEREKLGKKASPEIESRNCYSTLYVLCQNGKLREVTKKSVYSAL
jgi:hypothetical protein